MFSKVLKCVRTAADKLHIVIKTQALWLTV